MVRLKVVTEVVQAEVAVVIPEDRVVLFLEEMQVGLRDSAVAIIRYFQLPLAQIHLITKPVSLREEIEVAGMGRMDE
jgi:hypothetical protein